ncbi:MAG: hypothetical protein J3Q66DRAFT_386020 [Benniella sp.]|nr:MAG: hypothetical protein J3Q66DRAFT_386020 [Benniella sp.]
MVSKIAALTLLAAIASHINAFYFHVEIGSAAGLNAINYKIYPVDPQIPGNDVALVKKGVTNPSPTGRVFVSFYKYEYEDLNMIVNPGPELDRLAVLDSAALESTIFTCVKMDEFQQKDELSGIPLTWKVYECQSSDYYGKKGKPVNPPTTTTTAAPVATTNCPAVTVTVPVTVPVTPTTTNPPRTTTNSPKPSPTCLAGYKGRGNGKGPDGACCSHSDDCKDTCVKGICRDRCLTGYKGKKNGKGPDGACCSHSDDCKDTCVKGICGVHP